jgi:hypothetical protein
LRAAVGGPVGIDPTSVEDTDRHRATDRIVRNRFRNPAMRRVMPLVERSAVERAVRDRRRHRFALLERSGDRLFAQHRDPRRRTRADGREMRIVGRRDVDEVAQA